jgi:hypothetical protein
LKVLAGSCTAKKSPIDVDGAAKRGGRRNGLLGATDRVPDLELVLFRMVEEKQAMAGSKGPEVVGAEGLRSEVTARDTVGRIHCGLEIELPISHEAAEEGKLSTVVDAESAAEAGTGNDTEPAPADGGGAGEGRGLRGEAEEDLLNDVVQLQLRRRREAAHLALSLCLCEDDGDGGIGVAALSLRTD